MGELDDLLKRIHESPEEGLGSAAKLYAAAKESAPEGVTVTHALVKDWLKKQPLYQRFARVKNVYMPIIGHQGQIQVDLTFHGWKRKLVPILVAVNLTTRWAWARVLPNKEIETVVDAMENIIESRKGGKINIVESDAGSEFTGKAFLKMLTDHGIELVICQTGDHTSQGKVERLNRTIKMLIVRWKELHRGEDWREVIPVLIKNYNSTVHRSLTKFLGRPTSPIDVTLEDEEKIREAETAKSDAYVAEIRKLRVGDSVRKLIDKGPFGKGTDAKWSSKVYKIKGFAGWSVYLEDDDVNKGYRPRWLQVVAKGSASDYTRDEEDAKEKLVATGERLLRKEGIASAGAGALLPRTTRSMSAAGAGITAPPETVIAKMKKSTREAIRVATPAELAEGRVLRKR